MPLYAPSTSFQPPNPVELHTLAVQHPFDVLSFLEERQEFPLQTDLDAVCDKWFYKPSEEAGDGGSTSGAGPVAAVGPANRHTVDILHIEGDDDIIHASAASQRSATGVSVSRHRAAVQASNVPATTTAIASSHPAVPAHGHVSMTFFDGAISVDVPVPPMGSAPVGSSRGRQYPAASQATAPTRVHPSDDAATPHASQSSTSSLRHSFTPGAPLRRTWATPSGAAAAVSRTTATMPMHTRLLDESATDAVASRASQGSAMQLQFAAPLPQRLAASGNNATPVSGDRLHALEAFRVPAGAVSQVKKLNQTAGPLSSGLKTGMKASTTPSATLASAGTKRGRAAATSTAKASPSASPSTAAAFRGGGASKRYADDVCVHDTSDDGFERCEWVTAMAARQVAEIMPQVENMAPTAFNKDGSRKKLVSATCTAAWDPVLALTTLAPHCVNVCTNYHQLRVFLQSLGAAATSGTSPRLALASIGARDSPVNIAGVAMYLCRAESGDAAPATPSSSAASRSASTAQWFMLPLCSDDVLREVLTGGRAAATAQSSSTPVFSPPGPGVTLMQLIQELMQGTPQFAVPSRMHRWAALAAILEEGRIIKYIYNAQSFWYPLLRCIVTQHVQPVGVRDPLIAAYMLSTDTVKDGIVHAAAASTVAATKDATGITLAMLAAAYDVRVGSEVTVSADVHPLLSQLPLLLFVGDALHTRVAAAGMLPAYEHMDMPLTLVLARMEVRGFPVDMAGLTAAVGPIDAKIDELTAQARECCGVSTFNLGSPQECSHVLYDVLHLPKPLMTDAASRAAGEKRHASTNDAALEKLAAESGHVMPRLIQSHRKLRKQKTGFIVPLQEAAVQCGRAGKGTRIFTQLNLMSTGTGRLSSSNPNVQNLPAAGRRAITAVEEALGAPLNVRDAFVASRPGRVLLSLDYSQIEMRIMAQVCGDARLMSAFHAVPGQPLADFYTRTAAQVFGVRDVAEVTKDQRGQAKTVLLGMIYGVGPSEIASKLSITQDEAYRIINTFHRAYPGIASFRTKAVAYANRHKGTITLSGRHRLLPAIRDTNSTERAEAERQAVNTVVQGTAADLIKAAMVDLYRLFEHPAALDVPGATPELITRAHPELLLQVHDELVLEVESDAACVQAVANAVEYIMTVRARDALAATAAASSTVMAALPELFAREVTLRVPLCVEKEVGRAWGSMQSWQSQEQLDELLSTTRSTHTSARASAAHATGVGLPQSATFDDGTESE